MSPKDSKNFSLGGLNLPTLKNPFSPQFIRVFLKRLTKLAGHEMIVTSNEQATAWHTYT